MADYPERIPLPLSERLSNASAAIYSRFGREVDVAIGGIPFRLATTPELPQSIETIEVRKDQFDTEPDPGEQSLSGYWRRSQASFHEGAGNLYQESADNSVAGNGFYDSRGVDVFTQGQFSLLPKMAAAGTTASVLNRLRTYATGGVRTNLCTNPSLETDTTGWGVGGTNPPTIARSTTRAFSGAASCLTTWATGTGILKTTFPTFTTTVGATYTVSIYVWVPTGSVDVTLVISGVTIGPTTSLKDQWVRLSITFTATATTHLPEFWAATPPTAGMTVYSDAVLVEEGPGTNPFFDGNSVNGAWTGTANLSTSTLTIVSTGNKLSAVGVGSLFTNASGTFVALHDPTPTIVDGLVSGETFYDVASDGTLYQGAVSAPASATTWPCGTTPSRLGWGKHRLWIIGGRKLWQPNLSLSGGTAQNPIFTHPNQGWTYTCMAEGPSAMYFGGHDGYASTIQAITLDAGGGLPTLSGATVTAALPDGELVLELAVLAGQYVGIGTNRGFRVGIADAQNGSITYGPIIFSGTVSAISTIDKFFLVGLLNSEIVRKVDTSVELADLVFAYANNVEALYATTVTSIANASGTVAFTSANGEVWTETTNKVDSGWLQSGRIRYRTTEPKSYKFLNIELEPLNGSISADLILEGGSTLPLGSITQQGEIYSDAFGISAPPMRYVSVKLSLTRKTTDATKGPVINSYLLRAMPAMTPNRRIVLPLLCYDREAGKSGQRYGGEGYARDRLLAIHLLEDNTETITYQTFAEAGAPGVLVTIESARFVQTHPPDPTGREGAGGILILQLKTVEA